MQHLNLLWEEQKLEPKSAAWFKTPKPKEELYDLEKDPYELENLAGKLHLQDTLDFFRKSMDKWIVETGDLGQYPEKELMENWFPEGKPRKLTSLISKIKGGKIHLEHPDEGATIVWKKSPDSVWSVYSNALDFNKSIEAKAVRIGYDQSPLTTFN